MRLFRTIVLFAASVALSCALAPAAAFGVSVDAAQLDASSAALGFAVLEDADSVSTDHLLAPLASEQGTDSDSGDDGSSSSEEPEKEETSISGLMLSHNKKAGSSLSDSITVTGGAREVKLQMYNATKGTWVTKAVYTTNTKGTVKLVFPSNWEKYNKSSWRVKAPETETAQEGVSKTVTIVTRNRSKVSLSGKAAIIMDAETGDVYYDKNMDKKRSMASTTKMMTAILALEKKSLSSKVRITGSAVSTPYTYLPASASGSTAKMKDLLYGMMLPSDNGIAVALAQHVSGSVSKFAKQMTKKAKKIGCTKTQFKNPHGLTAKGHYSTAHDLARIAAYGMKNKTFAKVVNKKKYTFSFSNGVTYVAKTSNKIISTKGVKGVKTGTTDAAGYCFVGAYKYNGRLLITVTLGAKSESARWSDTKKLIKYVKKYNL